MDRLFKTCFVGFVILAVISCVSVAFPANKSTIRPPISDEALDSTLNDKRYLLRQLKCALGEAPCDPVGRRLKSTVPLVLKGNCPDCTPQEERQVKKVLAKIETEFPKEWEKIVKKYKN